MKIVIALQAQLLVCETVCVGFQRNILGTNWGSQCYNFNIDKANVFLATFKHLNISDLSF